MVSVKQQAKEAIDQLPDDCTFEDIQYHLYVMETIRKRIAITVTSRFARAYFDGNGHW